MEVELKLLVDSASIAAVKSHPVFAAVARPKRERLTTTYFDTPDLELWRQGASLRVRRTPKGFVQTVKIDDASQPIGARGEWEWPVPSPAPELDRLETLPEPLKAVRGAARRAEPVFTTEIERRIWQLALDGGTIVEAALDLGTAKAGARQADISELELELKGGSTTVLFGLAIQLSDAFSLKYAVQSKADRGYGLLTDELPPRHDASTVELPPHVSVAEAFPVLLGSALRAFAAEMPLAGRRDIEGVHRMRAAIRRIRSLLVLFDADLEPRAAERLNGSLREIGQVLGRGRDWDVFLAETLPAAQRGIGPGLVDPLRHQAEAAQTDAHAAVSQMMDGQTPTQLLLGLAAWVAGSGWFAGEDPDRPLRSRLPRMLQRLERKVHRRLRQVEGDDIGALHDVRKAMKKLRYSVECVASLYPKGEVEAYLATIKAVLSVLGQANDASVAAARTEDLAPPGRPELAPAAAALLAWTDSRRAKALHKLTKALRRFKAAEPFWA